MMFKSYTAARLTSSKPKKCKRCGIKDEKLQGYCASCLKADEPEIRVIVEQHMRESAANLKLGMFFLLITIVIVILMAVFL